MLKTTSQERGWIALAAVLWIVVMIGIIFIPQSRPSAAQAGVAPTNSLSRSVQELKPAGDAVVAQLVDPSRVYDAESYIGYTTLCPGEPEQMVDAKLQAFGFEAGELNLDGEVGHVLLIPAVEGGEPLVDTVNLNQVDICSVPQMESFPLNTAMPFYMNQGRWTLGMAQ